jgi:hypothetical protein
MKLTHIRYLLLTAAVMTVSCVRNHPIPENWKLPALGEGEKCPDISGHYMNKAEKTSTWVPPAGLISQWQGEFRALTTPPVDWKGEHQVLIRQANENQLEILYITDSGVTLSSHILKKDRGDFSCKDGWIITKEIIYNAPLPSTNIRSFAITENYLIEKVEWSTFSLLGFPGYAQGTGWLRFSNIESKVDEPPNR